MALATEAFLALSRAYLCETNVPNRADARTELLTRAYGSGPPQSRKPGEAAVHQVCAVSGENTRAR
jgi:hypothetical protein